MEQNHQYQVLVVEDEPSLQKAVTVKLTRAGLEPTAFDNGKLALGAIESRGKHFDGIWLDFDVREINGLEFMQKFTTIPDWERCPVIIVSNTGNPDLIREAIGL